MDQNNLSHVVANLHQQKFQSYKLQSPFHNSFLMMVCTATNWYADQLQKYVS